MTALNIVKLDKANFEQEVLKSPVPVVVDFWAEWCGPCKQVAPVLDELAGEYDNRVRIGKVDVGEEQELADQYGEFYLYLNKPIKTADLTGLNIRVSPMYLQVIKGLGGNPIVIPLTETYVALERHVVDGYCFVTVGVRDYGWQKVTKYIVDVPFYRGPNPILINLATWNGLPKKLRDLLTEATIEAEKKAVARFEDLQAKERPLLIKEGIQVIELPRAEKEKFLKVAFDEGWKDVIQKNPKTGPELKKLLTRSK